MKKFIVYLTINTVNRKIYIGVHKTDPNTFDKYIGNGVYIGVKFDTSTHFRRAVKKYGYDKFERLTLGVFDTAEEAYFEESILVTKEFVSRNTTYNMALGGFAGSTYSKKVLQYSLSGKFIKKWDSLTEVITYFNKKTHNALTKALTGKRESYLKFQWRYYSEDFPTIIIPIEARIPDKIYQYSLQGDFINEFTTAHAAAKAVTAEKDKTSTIISNRARIIKRATQTFGKYAEFQWRKFINVIPLTIEEFIDAKSVCQLAENLSIIKIWRSKKDVESSEFKYIGSCLSGRAASAYGFKWCYRKDYKSILDHDIVQG